jgi:hypothetical protein
VTASPQLEALAVSALAEWDQALATLDGGDAAQAAAVARGALDILDLGAAVAGQGRPGEALALLTRAQGILVARLPVGHPQVVVAAQCLEALAARS